MFRFDRTIISDFVDLLFPVLCLGCNKTLETNESIVCVQCRLELPETNQHRIGSDKNLLNKLAGIVSIQSVSSYFYFNKGGIAQKLIHAIKYQGQKEAAKEMAYWYGSTLHLESSLSNEIDLLVGVPLHDSRFQQRGYNQADWIAAGLAEALNVNMRTDILIRNKFIESQTNKNRVKRWENVSASFTVTKPSIIKGKRIALVDDVLTTGATIEACANELIKAGCKSIHVLTLAVAR